MLGIVDPDYKSPISSALINFGKIPITIREGKQFLRMTFHRFKKPKEKTTKEYLQTFDETWKYYSDRNTKAIAYLSNTFL